MLNNDTVGASFYCQASALPITGNSTTTTTPLNNSQWYYPYNGYYTPDYSLTGRIADLEGQVTVLREMVAALLSNKPTTRKRAKNA